MDAVAVVIPENGAGNHVQHGVITEVAVEVTVIGGESVVVVDGDGAGVVDGGVWILGLGGRSPWQGGGVHADGVGAVA